MTIGLLALNAFLPLTFLPLTFEAVQAEPATSAAQGTGSPNLGNLQLSVVGDFRIRPVDDSDEPEKSGLNEIEIGIASDVDPFLRAEAYIGIHRHEGETEIEIEEAFGRYSNLGQGLSAKFGKIAAAIGRVQRNHTDALNFMDYPLFVEDMFGEEGLRAPGVSLSYMLPGPRFNEITIEALDAEDDGPLFAKSRTNNPILLGHYRTFFDFNDDLSAQLGFSFLNGPFETDRSTLYGLDFTMKFQPAGRGRSMVFETEGYWAEPAGAEKVFGGFASLTYELQPKFFLTGKFDYSEIPGTSDIRRAWTAGLTFKVSEFHHWRAEFQRHTSNFESDRSVLTVQFQWAIGAHPAHRY